MTLEYYQQHARAFFESTVNVDMGTLYPLFLEYMPSGGRILDAGCGSGRDSKVFVDLGYRVDAFDASAEMVGLASQYTGLPVVHMTFREVCKTSAYDGIWCCASLLHVRLKELPEMMSQLALALKPGGIWYVSFKYGKGERMKEGRQFTDLNEKGLADLAAHLKDITIIRQWITEDQRPDRHERWLNALLQKDSFTCSDDRSAK